MTKSKSGKARAKAKKTNSTTESTESKAAKTAVDSEPAADSAVESTAEAEATKDPLAELSADELRDMLKRTAAERDNVARRAMQEIQKSRRVALNSFARGVCEVCDSLQAALESVAADAENNMREGVQLTLRKLLATMESNGIQPINPDVGAAFDTALHEAIGVNNATGKDANTVAQVVRFGYTLDGQVIRAAQVIVYQAAN